MKKKNIVKKNIEFEKIIKTKPVFKNEYFNVYSRNSNLPLNRFGISIPKALGKAVYRNKLKRRTKEIIDHYAFFVDNKDYIIIAKPKTISLNFVELKTILTMILKKINEVKKDE